jgi:capsular polysaccharide transport system permease protein
MRVRGITPTLKKQSGLINPMAEKIGEALYGWLQSQRHRLAFYIILLPMLLLTVYYLALAANRYVSEAKVVVKHSGDATTNLGGLSLPFLGAVGGASTEDAQHLREFIHSQDLLSQLDKQLDLRKEFSLHGLDVAQMLPPWATREDFLEMYRKRVEVTFDEKTGVLTIITQGYTPEFAQQFNQAILSESERFINEISHRVAREQVEFANQELQRSRKSLDQARDRLLGFQNTNTVLDPAATAEITQRVIAELEAQLAAREVELNTLSGMLQSDAAQVVTLRQTIAGLKQQIRAEQKKLTSTKGGALNKVAAEYLDYRALVDFQSDVYKISLATLEKMRLEAARKIKSLAVLSSPQLAEEAQYPRRAYMLGAWLFGLCMLFGLIRLTLEIVEDHRD